MRFPKEKTDMKQTAIRMVLTILVLNATFAGVYADENPPGDKPGAFRSVGVSVLQIGAGTATAFLGFIAGAFAAGLISLPFIHSGEGLELLGPMVIGGCAGLDLGCAAGVYWTGQNSGIENTYWSAVLGSTLGFIAGAVLSNHTDDMAFLFVLPAAFSTLTYNAFSKDEMAMSLKAPTGVSRTEQGYAFQESGTGGPAFDFRTSRYTIRFDLATISF